MKFKVKGYVHTADLTVTDDNNCDMHTTFWLDQKQLERLRDDITASLHEMDEAQGVITKDLEEWADNQVADARSGE